MSCFKIINMSCCDWKSKWKRSELGHASQKTNLKNKKSVNSHRMNKNAKKRVAFEISERSLPRWAFVCLFPESGVVWGELSTARRRNRGRQIRRETGTWTTRLKLSSRQLGLWKSREARCEAVFCQRSVPFHFSFSLLRACGFLITA